MSKKLSEMTFEEFIEELIKAMPQLLEAYQETGFKAIDKFLEDIEDE